MIRRIKEEERDILIRECLDNYDDKEYINFFFKYFYDPIETYVNEKEGKIVSFMILIPLVLNIANERYKVSFITAVTTIKEERNKGYMKELMNEILDMTKHRELFTLIETSINGLYDSFNFEPLFYRKEYYLNVDEIEVVSKGIIKEEIDTLEYYKLYAKFASHFDIYIRKELKDCALYLKELALTGGKIIINKKQDNVTGFISFFEKDDLITIDECIYLDTDSLKTLLSALRFYGRKVILTFSENEKVERYLPYLNKYAFKKDIYLRINNHELLSELYKKDIKTLKDLDIRNKTAFMRGRV